MVIRPVDVKVSRTRNGMPKLQLSRKWVSSMRSPTRQLLGLSVTSHPSEPDFSRVDPNSPSVWTSEMTSKTTLTRRWRACRCCVRQMRPLPTPLHFASLRSPRECTSWGCVTHSPPMSMIWTGSYRTFLYPARRGLTSLVSQDHRTLQQPGSHSIHETSCLQRCGSVGAHQEPFLPYAYTRPSRG